ncbi:hypothetical protein BDZ97DRAFT_1861916 [Flammula alnicola]|nr:hypothetical protein BDZ97DRAFT_1861916 [Flammula alnicola]
MSASTSKHSRFGSSTSSSGNAHVSSSSTRPRNNASSGSKPTASSSTVRLKAAGMKPATGAPCDSSSTHPQASSGSGSALDSVKETYDRLQRLGMPSEITLEVFTRLMDHSPSQSTSTTFSGSGSGSVTRGGTLTGKSPNNNNLKEALNFLSTHLVGREEARKARGTISRAREENSCAKGARPTSRIKAPSSSIHTHTGSGKTEDILDDQKAAAAKRREMAYRGLESVRKEYDAESTRMRVLDKQKQELRTEVEEKRRVEFLLKRLGSNSDGEGRGIGALVRDLRKESAIAIREFESITSITQTPIPTRTTRRKLNTGDLYKYKHTTEALAVILSCQLWGVWLQCVPGQPESRDAVAVAVCATIGNLIRGRVIIQSSNARVACCHSYSQNLHAYHVRCLRSGRGGGKGCSSDPTAAAAEGWERDIVERRLEDVLRLLGRMLVAVAHRRAETRRSNLLYMKNGEEEVVDEQRQVQEKVNRAVALGWLCEGYIDLISTFRSETAAGLSGMLEEEGKGKRKEGSFAQEVREVIGTTRVAVWDEVRDLLNMVAASERLTGKKPGLGEDGTQGANCSEEGLQFRVLERKSKKAEHGFEIASEIRELLGDVRKLK